MEIKITDKAIRRFLDTSVLPEDLGKYVSLCGPTFDKISKIEGSYVYDIEIITNRVDTASAQGIARESCAILNQMGIKADMKNDPYKENIKLYSNLPKAFNFQIENNDLVPRFTAVAIENIYLKDSPEGTKSFLTLCGQRPINNIVDITNELTFLYGMPCHIFDLDKLATQNLLVRESKNGEKVQTLDGQTNLLKGGDIVIEDGTSRLVDLCGIMGGSAAEVDPHTKNILVIVPVYQPSRIRRTSLYLQKRTLAAQIYEKQPDTELCLPVLMNAIALIKERANGQVSSAVYDSNPARYSAKTISLETNWARRLIGQNISNETMVSILSNLGFEIIHNEKSKITCGVPSWRRHDIKIKEDLIEEVARVYGYSKLPSVLPCVNLAPETKEPVLVTETKIKHFLSDRGFNEIYNNPLISAEQIENSLFNAKDHLKLTNALSREFEYLRVSLIPSVLQNLKNNQGKSEEPFYLYELSNVYLPTKKEVLPQEPSKLVIASTDDFRHVKGTLDLLFKHLNLRTYQYLPSSDSPKCFLDGETAVIISKDAVIGYIGTIKPVVLHNFGVTSAPVVAELDVRTITQLTSKNYEYHPISDFPDVIEQMTINSKINIGSIIEKIKKTNDLITEVEYLDSFQNNHSFKITFSSPKNNLTQNEVNKIKDSIQNQF